MTATSTDRDPKFSDDTTAWYNVANGSTIYMGTLVMVNASGLAVPATDNSSNTFVGVSLTETVTGTGASGSSTYANLIKVRRKGICEVNFSGTLTQADIGDTCACVDNQTVASLADASGDVVAGQIVEIVSSSKCRVDISNYTSLAP